MPARTPVAVPALFVVVSLVSLVSPLLPAAAFAADTPFSAPDRLLAEGWTVDGYIDPASGEGQRAQVGLDPDGAPIAVWANRLVDNAPYELVSSRFDGTGWSSAEPIFPASPFDNQLPRMAHAADGTLWLTWLRYDDRLSSATPFASLIAARRIDGAWAEPETVATGLSLPNRALFPSEFAVHAVSRDEAWIVYAIGPQDNPFSTDRDLYSVHCVAGVWGDPIVVSAAGLPETRPEIAAGPGGRPVVFFGFASAPSVLWAMAWTGSAWEQGANDVLSAYSIFEHAVQPDSSGAVRMIGLLREETKNGLEDHIREYVWNATGFRPGPIIFQAAVVKGGETQPPDWVNLSLATTNECNPPCAPNALPRYRVLWTDFTPGSPAKVLSAEREPGGFASLDSPGSALFPAESYPNAAYDATLDRWYAVWTAPPTTGARLRAKFAWTQSFAGDIGIGGTFLEPDTARITVVCSGDASDREFRIYRLAWDDLETNPPLAPPIPSAAVELPGSPFSGPCPFQVDDVLAEGRYFYYVELVPDGTFPG